MLKVRVIPTLLMNRFGLVKGKNFLNDRRVGSILPAIKVYNLRDVDEMILLDIEKTSTGEEPDFISVKDYSLNCSMPFTVGGGISSIDHIKRLIQSGADKVSLNTSLYQNSSLARDAVNIFGTQCIIASIDVRKIGDDYICFSNSGSINEKVSILKMVDNVLSLGVGEILLTSIDKDGTMSGYDYDLISLVAKNIDIPLIASGGAGKCSDFVDAYNSGASALAAASIFHFTETTPLDVKKEMMKAGIPVRLN